MNFKEARKKSIIYKCIGALIIIPGVISTIISFLKMIYFRLDDGSRFGSAIAKPFKIAVEYVHQHTDFLIIFWERSPTPNHMDLFETQNIYFILIYLAIFVGLTFWGMGTSLSKRLRQIRKKIEDQVIEESIKGGVTRTQAEIVNSIAVPNNDMFSEVHKLYLAPIVVAVVGGVLAKLL